MKKVYIASVAIIMIFLTSCTKILNDFEFEDKDPKIVVQAKFTPDSAVRVFVTRSLDMYDRREIKTISAASVNLFSGTEKLASFNNDSKGWYSIDPGQIETGKNYRLEIEAEGYPKASSEFAVPVLPEIERVDTAKIRRSEGPYSGLITKGICTLHFKDNAETEDYYVVSIKRKALNFSYNDYGEIIDSAEYYNYSYISSESPYLELVYLDYSGYARPNSNDFREIHKLYFSDKRFNGKEDVSIDIQFSPEYWGQLDPDLGGDTEEFIDVYFTSIDKNLFEYARTKAEVFRATDNPLAEPVTPYSSVVDGYGLVYGESEKKIPVNITGLFTQEDYNSGGYYYEY